MKRLYISVFAIFILLNAPCYALDIDADSNDAVDVTYGGTNASSASDARDNLGLTIGTDVLAPDGDGSSLTGILATQIDATAWRIFYSNGDGDVTELALGAAGTYLKSAGADAAPSWDVAGGAGGGTIGGTLGSTDNVIVRSDGTGGVTAQGSLVTVSDAGGVNIPAGQTYNIGGSAHTHNYQPLDADLTTYAGITPSANVQSLMGAATYAAMRTLLDLEAGTDFNAYDADLAALAGLSGVRGDIIYRDATQWQRLAAGDSGKVLKMGDDDPFWGDDNNDGGEGISTWDEIDDSAADTTIAFAGYKTIFTSTLNAAGSVFTQTNTTADLTSDVSFFDFKYTDNGDANGYFLRGYDNSGGDLKWYIGPEGAFYGYSYETAQSATGGVLDLLEGSGAGTDYIRIKADDDVGTNRLLAISTSVADSEDLTIQLGANDNTATIASTTGVANLTFSGMDITVGDDLFLASDSAVLNFGADNDVTLTHVADTGLTLNLDLTVGGGDVSLGAAGVKLTGANGALTILGLGDGSDEDVKIDLNTTANTIEITSPASSATAIDINSLNLVSTGTISGAIPSTTDNNGQTLSAAQQYGYMHWATGAGTTNLVTAVAGMSLCVYSTTAAAVVVNPADGDTITLNGTALSAGDSITSASGAGDFICLMSQAANSWVTLGRSGTWTDTN